MLDNAYSRHDDSWSSDARSRPPMNDVVSPITDKPLALELNPEEARKSGRIGYDKPTPKNTIFLFIDHQIGLMAGVRDFAALSEYKNNVVALARMAKALAAPVLIT